MTSSPTRSAAFDNPVLQRETRARWRGRAFAVLFGYAFLLGIAMLWAYGTANTTFVNPYSGAEQPHEGAEYMARVGHNLFQALSGIQTGCWMLLAPALTATSIAWERETGSLESIQLSPLPGHKIIVGKLASALFFIGLLLIAALPVSSICFLMGGVSPDEFRIAFLLQVVTAITGAVVGVCCSALSRRSNNALALTFSVMIIWFFGSLLSGAASRPRTGYLSCLCAAFSKTNPLFAVLDLTSPAEKGFAPPSTLATIATPPSWIETLLALPMWKWSLSFQVLLWIPLFWIAAHHVVRPLPEAEWLGERKQKTQRKRRRGTQSANPASLTSAANEAAALAGSAREGRAARSTPSQRWYLPIAQHIHFKNPLLQREARSKFRLRRLSFIPMALGSCLLLGLLYAYGRYAIIVVNEPLRRLTVWSVSTMLLLILSTLCCAVMGGAGLARECEARTWEGLGMSLLSAREIISAKVRAPLVAVILYSLPIWPLLLFCMLPVDPHQTPAFYEEPLRWSQIIGTVLLHLATIFFVIVLGSWISWGCKRTATAIGWTVGIMLLGWAFVPAFIIGSVPYREQKLWTDLFGMVNPFFALGYLNDGYKFQTDERIWRSLFCAGLLCVMSTVLLFSLHHSIKARRFGFSSRSGKAH